MTHVLVTGGTGAVGAVVARRLLESGHRVRIGSRRPRPPGDGRPYEWSTVDYRDGSGLADAVAGVDAIAHCAHEVGDTTVEQRLTAAALDAGVRHLVSISIVGVDRIPFRFYRNQLATERVVRESGVPWTVLRATQFHGLVRLMLAGLTKSPVLPVPDAQLQPVDVTEVGARLAELAVGEPAGYAPEFGGPHVHTFRELAETYLGVTGRRRTIVSFTLPGKVFRSWRDGDLLTPEHAEGKITFREYLLGHHDRGTLRYRTEEA